MNYEDYFYEPNEFEQQVEEFKDVLKQSVAKEIADRIVTLENENKILKERVKGVDELEKTYKVQISHLEGEKANILRGYKQELYNATLKDLFDNCTLFQRIYKIDQIRTPTPKCDLCDDKRNVIAVSPDGREHTVGCSCRFDKLSYQVNDNTHTAIYIQKGKKEDNFRFEVRNDSSYEYGHRISEVFEKFDENNPISLIKMRHKNLLIGLI